MAVCKFPISFRKWAYFGFQIWAVRMILRYLHLQNRKHQFWAICAAFGVNAPFFRVNFFPQFSFYLNSFYPNFFFTQFFFTQTFFLPKFFFSNFFWDLFFFLPNFFYFFSTFNNISQVICMLHVATRTVDSF